MKNNFLRFLPVAVVAIAGVVFVYLMNDWFESSPALRSLFSSGETGSVMGEVAEN